MEKEKDDTVNLNSSTKEPGGAANESVIWGLATFMYQVDPLSLTSLRCLWEVEIICSVCFVRFLGRGSQLE